MDGWIKLHRKLLEWEWYDDSNTLKLFIHLLLTVNSKPRKWRGEEIQPGQRVVGRSKLAEELNLTEMQIRTALKKLKATNEITIKSTPQYSVITLNSWIEYQESNQQNNQRVTNEQPTNNQRVTTNKNVENVRREEEYIGSFENDPPSPAPPKKKNSAPKGSRLPDDWYPSTELFEWALKERPDLNVQREIEIFRDYWHAKTGANAVKLDWDKTFRNWIRRANGQQKLYGSRGANNIPGNQIAPASERRGGTGQL